MTDHLSPIFTLTPAEITRVRTVAADDPEAVLPALAAALGQAEHTLDMMRLVFEGVKPCES